MPDFYEDKDIKLFQEDYPDVYKFIVRLIDGQCDDKKIENFIDEYGEDVYDYIKKIVDGELDDEDVRRLKEEYSEEIHVAIQKMVERKADRLSKAKPQITPFKKGDFIGQEYEVYDVLGMGGFGIVYLVYSHETKEVYALKTFRDEYLEDVTTRERFRKEAQVWIDLERHPYLVRAYFVDEISGRLFIAMEYIAPDEMGLNNLEGFLRHRPPELAQALRWAIQFCHGMEYAYSKGVKAHRDIKPANIMIGQDNAVKISDFGLAGVVSPTKLFSDVKPSAPLNVRGEVYQTMEGTAFGTPPYMPPEQFENAAGCDERSDIYSFGVVLYQMVSSGNLPFYLDMAGSKADNVFQDWYKLHCKSPVPKLKSPLSTVIQKCLEKEQRKRYQTFKDLRSDLELLLKRETGEVIKLPEQKELEAWEWNMKGGSLTSIGKYEEAVVSFDKALEMIPCFAEVWNNKGIALKSAKKLSQAMECFNKSIECYKSLLGRVRGSEIRLRLSQAWHNKSSCLNSMGQFSEAIHCIKKALELNPASAGSWGVLGNSLMSLGNFEEALKSFERVLKLDMKDSGAWHRKGLCLDNLGRCKEALHCYDEAITLNPLEMKAWHGKAMCLTDQKIFSKAFACIKKAVEIQPEDAFAWYIKAGIEESINRTQDAIMSYKKFIALASNDFGEALDYAHHRISGLQGKDTGTFRKRDDKHGALESDAEGWISKGEELYNLGKYQKAVDCFSKAIEINSQNERVWFLKGVSLSKLGRLDESLQFLDRALDINPLNQNALYYKGGILMKLNRIVEAKTIYEKMIELDPAYSDAWFNLALIYEHNKQFQEAIRCHKEAIRINPTDKESLKMLVQLYFNIQDKPSALYYCDKLIEATKSLADLANKARILSFFGEYEKGVALLNDVLAEWPKVDLLWFALSEIHEQHNNYSKALKAAMKCREILQQIQNPNRQNLVDIEQKIQILQRHLKNEP